MTLQEIRVVPGNSITKEFLARASDPSTRDETLERALEAEPRGNNWFVNGLNEITGQSIAPGLATLADLIRNGDLQVKCLGASSQFPSHNVYSFSTRFISSDHQQRLWALTQAPFSGEAPALRAEAYETHHKDEVTKIQDGSTYFYIPRTEGFDL
jgi:hypothetical protein